MSFLEQIRVPWHLIRHRLVQQAGEMLLWQILSKGLAFFASAWAARCLGPEKLGISGMIAATTTQIGLLISLNLDILLTRHFKANAEAAVREELTTTIFTFRLVAGGILGLVGLIIFLIWSPGSEWHLGILAAFPMLLATVNPPGWLLMGQENMPANSRAGALQSIVVALLYFVFFRPGQATGSDLVVGAVGACVAFAVGWFAALHRLWPMPFDWRKLRQVWPLMREGRWLTLSGVVIYIYVNFDAPLLGYLHSLPELGKYRTATMLTGAAQQFLAFIPMLLYPRILSWKNAEPGLLWRRQNKMVVGAILIMLPVAALNFSLVGWAYPKLFGPAFAQAAYPFAILLMAKFVVIISQLYVLGLWAHGEDKQVFWLMAATAGISLALNCLLIPQFGMWAAASVNLLSELTIAVGCYWLARRKNKQISKL